MTPVWRLALSLGAATVAAAAGWWSVPPSDAAAPRPNHAPRAAARPAPGASAVAAAERPAAARLPGGPTGPAAGARRVTPDIELTAQEQEYLRHDPVQWSKQLADDTRAIRMEQCQAKFEHHTPEDCERMFQATIQVGPKYLELQRQFLSGAVDQDAYQTSFHRIMLEQALDIEQALSPKDFFAFLGTPGGEDLFINLNGGIGRIERDHFKLGNDVLDRDRDQSWESP